MAMRFRAGLLAGLLVWAWGTSVSALDFSLSSALVEEDGFKREQWYFHGDGETDVFISLPAHWERRAEPGSLTLASGADPDAMVRLEKSPVTPDHPFKGPGLEAYRRRVLGSVPAGATETQLTEERDDPLPIFHWESHEFVVDYVFFGRAFRRSVLFVDLDAAEQIQVTTVAPKGVFEGAHAVAFDVLRSWQVVPRQ